MKYYLGIDPGKQGAFVIIDENSNVIEKIGTPLIGKDYDKQGIIDILKSREFHKIGLENPSVIFGIGKSASKIFNTQFIHVERISPQCVVERFDRKRIQITREYHWAF